MAKAAQKSQAARLVPCECTECTSGGCKFKMISPSLKRWHDKKTEKRRIKKSHHVKDGSGTASGSSAVAVAAVAVAVAAGLHASPMSGQLSTTASAAGTGIISTAPSSEVQEPMEIQVEDPETAQAKRTVTELHTSNEDQPFSNGVDVSEMDELEGPREDECSFDNDAMDIDYDFDMYALEDDARSPGQSSCTAEGVDRSVDDDTEHASEARDGGMPGYAAEGVDTGSIHFIWGFILCLAASLNLHFHVTHRAINLMLTVVSALLVRLGHFSRSARPATTLKTVFKQLQLNDCFKIAPMCPSCRRIFPLDSDPELQCDTCELSLFKTRTLLRGNFDGTADVNEHLTHEPILKYPYQTLTSQLEELLAREGMEDELDNWKIKQHVAGLLTDITDGSVWKTLKAHDGTSFFDPETDELRISLILLFDGFGGERSNNGPTYSSGVLSHCIANLPIHLKYQPRNLFLSGIIPGPKEVTCDQLQHALRIDTDEKLTLYQEGFLARTPSCPEGRRCRVLCFCTMCKAKHDDLRTPRGMTKEFEPRTDEEHRRHATEYRHANLNEREALFKRTGVRYAESLRLPYFHAITMGIIDPMHNILLGICRTQWLDAWVRKNVLRQQTRKKRRELDQIHGYLRKFEMPSWVGRLPRQVGYPAGGSLSADEYKALVLVYCPLIIPLIWKEWVPIDQQEFRSCTDRWEAQERQRLHRITNGTATEEDQTPKKRPPPPRMHPDDSANFLKLAAALKIILGRSIRTADLSRAERLLKEYLCGFLTMHKDCVKPNHHYITHIFDQICSYGPVYGFWTFTSERLNKLLKSIKTNNHNGGEIEVSFFRGFTRDVRLHSKLSELTHQSSLDDILTIASKALQCENEVRGTVASIASMVEEVDALYEEYNKSISLSTASNTATLDDELQNSLLEYYQNSNPEAAIVSRTARFIKGMNLLNIKAVFFSYLILQGRHIAPSAKASKAPNSIIQLEFNGELFVGQVINLFTHTQHNIRGPKIFLHVRWFKPRNDVNTEDWDP
ncbi:hypothetical protein ACEPAF_3722 [Sanghuangporus sanghuang]